MTQARSEDVAAARFDLAKAHQIYWLWHTKENQDRFHAAMARYKAVIASAAKPEV